jgi:hypothetical protein
MYKVEYSLHLNNNANLCVIQPPFPPKRSKRNGPERTGHGGCDRDEANVGEAAAVDKHCAITSAAGCKGTVEARSVFIDTDDDFDNFKTLLAANAVLFQVPTCEMRGIERTTTLAPLHFARCEEHRVRQHLDGSQTGGGDQTVSAERSTKTDPDTTFSVDASQI